MKSIEGIKNGAYELDGVDEASFPYANVFLKFTEGLAATINDLKARLEELEEINNGNEQEFVYLMKNTDSDYAYYDICGTLYKLVKTNDKCVLLNTHNYKSYEIIEYCNVRDVQEINKSSWCVSSYVDKVVRVVLLGK